MSHPVPGQEYHKEPAEYEPPVKCAELEGCDTGIAGQKHNPDCPKFQDNSHATSEEEVQIW